VKLPGGPALLIPLEADWAFGRNKLFALFKMLNFFIKSAKAGFFDLPSYGAVPTLGVLYGLVVKALSWFFSFALVIAIIMIISVGVSLAAQGANVDSRKQSLNRLYFTIVGVMLMFAAWVIVTQVIPEFLGMGSVDLEGSGSGTLWSWFQDLFSF